jgi:transposase-like protein
MPSGFAAPLENAITPIPLVRFISSPDVCPQPDQLGSYPKAISRLQREGKLSSDTKHRTCKYLNNIIEADHGALKRVIRPARGLSDHEDGRRYDEGVRGDADDPPRTLPHL